MRPPVTQRVLNSLDGIRWTGSRASVLYRLFGSWVPCLVPKQQCGVTGGSSVWNFKGNGF